MEESLNIEFHDCIKEMLNLKEVDVNSYSPLVLAYIGDCVFDHKDDGCIRRKQTGSENAQRDKLLCPGIRSVIDDACYAGTFDRGRTQCIPKRKKRKIRISGKKPDDHRLQKGYRF